MTIFFRKILAKLTRTIKGYKLLLYMTLTRSKVASIFIISKIAVECDKQVFNIAATNVDNKTILMGREFFNIPNSLQEKDIYLGFYDDEKLSVSFTKPLGIKLLKDNLPGFIRLEDPRPFCVGKGTFAICACIISEHRNPSYSLKVQQIVVKVDHNEVSEYLVFETNQVFEKNWVIFLLQSSKISLCYSLCPLIFIDVPLELGNRSISIEPEVVSDFLIRNSTNYILLDGFKFSVCHKYIDLGFRYLCIHFFAKINPSGEIVISESFVFNGYGNEYATSLLHSECNDLMIFFSDHKQGNFIAKLDLINLSKFTWIAL